MEKSCNLYKKYWLSDFVFNFLLLIILEKVNLEKLSYKNLNTSIKLYIIKTQNINHTNTVNYKVINLLFIK